MLSHRNLALNKGKIARQLLFALVIILLLATMENALAIEYDPIQFLTKQTYVLRENETVKKFIVISYESKPYYVVQISANDAVVGYIALEKFNKKVVEEKVKSKVLFQTAEFIARYTDFKKEVNDNPSYIWFILKYNDIPTIKQKLENEKLELSLIAQTVSSHEGVSKANALSSMLDVIISELDELHSKMLDAVSFESQFLKEPIAGEEIQLKEKLIDSYETLEGVFRDKQEYESLLLQLKIDIANDPELDRDTKKQLNETADLPDEAKEIDKWYTSATNMQFKENLESIYLDASDKSTSYAEQVASRLKRDSCYRFIYEENTELEKKTNNELMTLKEAYTLIMDEKNYDKWKNRLALKELKTNWAKMLSNLEKEDYDTALKYARKALNNAIDVYKEGFFVDNGKTEINYELIFQAAIAIIVILMVIYAIRSRKKLVSLISGEGDEEVEFGRL